MPEPKPDPNQPDAFELVQQLVALVFELPKQELPDLTTQIGEALKSAPVQNAIRSSLLSFQLKTGKGAGMELTEKEKSELLASLTKAGGPAIEKQLLEQFKKSPQYQKIEATMAALKVAVKQSPLGVWVDKEKSLLVVVGIVVGAAGSAALFYTKTGGPVVDIPINQIKGKVIPIWSPGSFKLGAKLLEFQPAVRQLGVEVIGDQKWGKLDLTFGLGVIASDTGVKRLNGEATVVKSKDFRLGLDGSYDLPKKETALGFRLGLDDNKVNLSLHAIFDDKSGNGSKFSGGDLTAGLNFKAFEVGVTGRRDQATSVMLTLTLPTN